ncbi:MAG: hypothetical protein GEU79_08350 [Acidimicrobiia bacterium]|nr:hypothetical protein [Acidimicrobiia bacterium]
MAEEDVDKSDEDDDGSWGWYLLIPAMALSIPIFAVLGDASGPLVYVIAAIVLIASVTVATRYLMDHRHKLRLEEISAQEKVVRAERDHLSAAERILELDDAVRIREEPDSDLEPPTTV